MYIDFFALAVEKYTNASNNFILTAGLFSQPDLKSF